MTKSEVPDSLDLKDGVVFVPALNTSIAFVMAPDHTLVEFVENASAAAPIAMQHVHFTTPKVEEMKTWHLTTFDAKPGKMGPLETADLPGVRLLFPGTAEALVGMKDHVLDHIGFEVKNLEAFCFRGLRRSWRPWGALHCRPELGTRGASGADSTSFR